MKPSEQIVANATYKHLKSGVDYIVIALAITEARMENVVVYKSTINEYIWTRPIEEFKERFELVASPPKNKKKKLKAITDEDKIKVAKIFTGLKHQSPSLGDHIIERVFSQEVDELTPLDVIKVYQYLQSQDYELPTYY